MQIQSVECAILQCLKWLSQGALSMGKELGGLRGDRGLVPGKAPPGPFVSPTCWSHVPSQQICHKWLTGSSALFQQASSSLKSCTCQGPVLSKQCVWRGCWRGRESSLESSFGKSGEQTVATSLELTNNDLAAPGEISQPCGGRWERTLLSPTRPATLPCYHIPVSPIFLCPLLCLSSRCEHLACPLHIISSQTCHKFPNGIRCV